MPASRQADNYNKACLPRYNRTTAHRQASAAPLQGLGKHFRRPRPGDNPRRLLDGRQTFFMGLQLGSAGMYYRQRRARWIQPANHPDLAAGRIAATLAGQQQRGLATGHDQVDVCQDLGVEQGAVQITLGVVYAVALAQRIEAVALIGVLIPGAAAATDDRARIRYLPSPPAP